MNIDDLTIGDAKKLAALFSDKKGGDDVAGHLIGKRVIVRSENSGVHYGTLKHRNGGEVLLAKTRRVWKWSGAFTLSEVAERGVASAKMPPEMPEIFVRQVIEIIRCSEAAATSLDEAKAHVI